MARCPACFVPMTRVEEDLLKSFTCPECFGTWMSQTALIRRMRMDADQNVDVMAGGNLEDLIEVAAQTDAKAPLRCAGCAKPMMKGRLHPLIPVIVDRCIACCEVWMDAGEYRLIRYLHKEMVTTDDP